MDSSLHGTTPLRQRMIDDMRMRKFADKTQSQYIRAVRQLAAFLGRSPDTATVEDLRRYQLHLVDLGTSPVSLNAAITGLKFFFEVTLDQGELMAKMDPVRVPRTLPVVLSRDEVARPDCGDAQSEASDGTVGRLWRRAARQRGDRAKAWRHRQST